MTSRPEDLTPEQRAYIDAVKTDVEAAIAKMIAEGFADEIRKVQIPGGVVELHPGGRMILRPDSLEFIVFKTKIAPPRDPK